MLRTCVLTLLACASPVFAANLLTNGNFETGTSQGWTSWRAPWGQQEQYSFNDATAGRSGQFDLKITARGSSFGVDAGMSEQSLNWERFNSLWEVERACTHLKQSLNLACAA